MCFVVAPVLLHPHLHQVTHSWSEITISAMNYANAAKILSDELQISQFVPYRREELGHYEAFLTRLVTYAVAPVCHSHHIANFHIV